jgi:hypothetical protein
MTHGRFCNSPPGTALGKGVCCGRQLHRFTMSHKDTIIGRVTGSHFRSISCVKPVSSACTSTNVGERCQPCYSQIVAQT